jgi:adenine/guanine phosphoribosyltransferase-like PRPP-binding protein
MAVVRTTSWISHAWDSEVEMVERFQSITNPYKVEFDTLIGTGFSGGLVVPVLARMLNVNFAVVRKDGVSNHGNYDVEGIIGEKWIFVDDLIDSGSTVRRVVRKMKALRGVNTEFAGVYLYDSRRFITPRFADIHID